ncbi:hypothetical protein AJ87_05015 [Rhizobium yanglingense]|nr:hypothetical protein AJ87_05015 [Rhizobium yanglingense]
MPLGIAGTALAVERQLVYFAAKADHQDATEIDMARVARKRAVKDRHAITRRAHAAALVVHDRHEAVDALVIRQDGAIGLVCNRTADGGGTVHAGDDADIVAGRRPAIGAAITHEGSRAVFRGRRLRRGIRSCRQPIVLEMQVMAVDMIAGLHLGRRSTDRLAIFHYRRAERDVGDRNLVAGFDFLPGLDTCDGRSGFDPAVATATLSPAERMSQGSLSNCLLPEECARCIDKMRIDFVFYLQ